MAWIESHESLPGHPKTKRLRRILKISRVEAIGHLHFFWWWAMNHAQDGNLERYSAADIADACEWEGDENEFLNALVSAGFIDKSEQGYCIHDWYKYAGKLIELRRKDAERKRNPKDKQGKSDGVPTEIQWNSDGVQPDSIRNPNPNPNLNHNHIRESVLGENPHEERLRKLINECGLKGVGIDGLETVYSYIGQVDIEVIEKAIKKAEKKHIPYFVTVINGFISEGKTTKESIEPNGGVKNGRNDPRNEGSPPESKGGKWDRLIN